VEVVGRRWSQAGGGAPRVPNNGGAAALWWSRGSGVPAVLYAAEQDGLRSVNSSTRPRHGHDMTACVRGVRRRRRWAGGGTVGSAWPRRAARGARGVGKEGGAAPGDPTARGPTDQGRPRQACTTGGSGSTQCSGSM
jgi:hypothetical protein